MEYSHQFAYVGLTENRILNVQAQAENAPALGTNLSDKFWARANDPNFEQLCADLEASPEEELETTYWMVPDGNPNNISLYCFASHFTASWHLRQKPCVPHPSPNYKYVPMKDNRVHRDGYIRTALLLFQPDASPTNVGTGFATLEEAMAHFVTTPLCPGAIRDDYMASLKRTVPIEEDKTIQDLVGSQMSNVEVEFSQDSVMRALGTKLTGRHDLDDPEPEGFDPTDDDYLIEEIKTNLPDVNWDLDRNSLKLSHGQIEEAATTWLEHQQKLCKVSEPEDPIIDVETLNAAQRQIYELAKEVVDAAAANAPVQKLIDLSGSAGTGKSYVIRAIRQYAIATLGNRTAVQIAAPTGSAAALLPGGRTLHSVLKIRAEDTFDKHEEPLGGRALAEVQENFARTVLFIIDEKSMVGVGRLSQIHRRLCQAKPKVGLSQQFGGISLILAGDLATHIVSSHYHYIVSSHYHYLCKTNKEVALKSH